MRAFASMSSAIFSSARAVARRSAATMAAMSSSERISLISRSGSSMQRSARTVLSRTKSPSV